MVVDGMGEGRLVVDVVGEEHWRVRSQEIRC